MNKLAELIKELPYEDALLVKKDLDKGNIDKLIKTRIHDAKHERLSLCPICSSPVQEALGYYLEFGKKGFRKKATFDTPHCLKYFLDKNITTNK